MNCKPGITLTMLVLSALETSPVPNFPLFAKNILCVGSEIGRLPPQFGDAAKIATNILNSGFEYDSGKMLFNRFKSVVSYDTTEMPIYSMATVNNAEKLALYDSLDADVLQSYMEYSLASLIYYCLKEGACSEQSSRMTAMDNSSKNAGEMIDKLTLFYNRSRQAVITGELIEIISGAAALSTKPQYLIPILIFKKRTWRTNGLDQALHRFTEKIKKYFLSIFVAQFFHV